MLLVFVHGRAQVGRSAAEIEAEWIKGLRRGFEAAGVTPPEISDLSVPFYGDVLDSLSKRDAQKLQLVIERGDSSGGGPSAVETSLAEEVARRAGITTEMIEAELAPGTRERGPENWEWVQAIGRALDKHTPWIGSAVLSAFVSDVNAYLKRAYVRQEINSVVKAAFRSKPAVVVAHSLGTIVAYEVLREMKTLVEVPLYVTLGSPLGMETVKNHLRTPLDMPAGVRKWFNAADERDPVALHCRLDRDHFPVEIENLNDVHNPKDDPHSISGYLSDAIVARKIAELLT